MSYFRLAGLADHFRTSVLIRSSVHSPKGTVFGLDEQVPLNAHLNAHQIDGYIAMPSRDFRVPATLRREIDAAHQVLKAGIGTQIVEDRVNLKPDHPISVLLVGGFEPTEGFFRLPQSSVDPAYSIR
jgi:hypothetical protein